MTPEDARFTDAMRRFDAANGEDPTSEKDEHGVVQPKELLYARRMSACLGRVAPGASEALQLAVRSQHIRRWVVPRHDFPLDRPGYHQWRNHLKKYHAEVAGGLLQEVGYTPELVARVQQLIQKQGLAHDPETQLLEDVICLVFLEYYLLDFAARHPVEKVIDIVQKTWRKMTPQGQQLALELPLPASARALVGRALAGS
jgi:Domain of unknown function (DUF4202)